MLPPKRLLATTFLPSAWVDDSLIAERKSGLKHYLSELLRVPEYKDNATLLDFLTRDSSGPPMRFDLEDAVPSTLSRKAALNITAQADSDVEISATMVAAAYYPGLGPCDYRLTPA